jgi:hypothetical protein
VIRSMHSLRFVRESFIPTSLSLFSILFLLLSASGFATSVEKNTNPCNLTESEMQGLSHDASTEVNALDDYIATVSSMVHAERFDALDCIGDRARANKERFPGGHWKIHELYKGLDDPTPSQHATEEDWKDLTQVLQRWVETHPKSVTARVALSWTWIRYASEARGNGYADTVSQNGWKLYEERTEKAQKIIADAASLPVTCPESYVVKLNIAQHQGWGKDGILALYREAAKFEPGYYYYGRAVAMLLEPKWFGEEGDTAKFVEDEANRIGGKAGDAYYFQLASTKDVICGCEDQPKLSLERVERGYGAVEQMYGVSMLNLNQLAFLTVHLGNKPDVLLTDQTLQRIGTQWSKYSWGDERTFGQTKDWVRQVLPAMKEHAAREAEGETNAKTPEGAHYQASIEKAYRDILRECVRSDGGEVHQWRGEFETLILVGAAGTVEDVDTNCMGPVVQCLFTKMRSARQTKAPLFPAPPKGSYWVRIDLDWSEFAPATARR